MPEAIRDPERVEGIRFQIIYVIHGDGGYLWYDDSGSRREADREALAMARSTAEAAEAAEVFIFHQRPTRFLRFFHGSDGTLWHYRQGKLVRRLPYDRGRALRAAARAGAPSLAESARPAGSPGSRAREEEEALAAEAALFARFAARPAPRRCPAPQAQGAAPPQPARIFCYFGHGIPMTGKAPYSRSRPEAAFPISAFARGLVRFGGPACPPEKPFSLVVLSSCHGGTPEATLALSPYADWILASPGELHLSYLDTRALGRLAKDASVPADPERMGTWARIVAEESFARLRRSVRTGVSIGIYETAKAEAYLRGRRGAWAETPEFRAADSAAALPPLPSPGPGTAALPAPSAGVGGSGSTLDDPGSAADGEGSQSPLPPGTPLPAGPLLLEEPSAYRDCGENPGFGPGGEEAGVALFYRPPRFGIDRGKAVHSGWECPEAGPRRASARRPQD